MRVAGIDIGSRTIKLVISENDEVIETEVRLNSYDPLNVCREMLDNRSYDALVATGYGRHLFARHFDCQVVTEIRAVALGARARFSDCRAILDIGGQDTKAIALDENGRVGKFEMNDKCAAGTGRFLEVMATALGYTLEEFAENALKAEKAKTINAMCTVFAESEVIGLLARDTPREELARGLHLAVAKRAVGMLRRVSDSGPVAFCGGTAKNACLARLIEEAYGSSVSIADDPQTIAALGCTLAVSVS